MIYIEKHICPFFEDLGKPLEDLTPLDIKAYVTEKRTAGRLDGKKGGLSPVSVRKHLNLIKQALREAAIFRLVPTDPSAPIRLPRTQTVTENARFIPIDEAKAVIRAFKGHRLHALIYVTLIYGLRRSEVLGLKWSAIDFAENSIVIRHTVVKASSIVAKDRTKTASSRRTFPLLPEIAELLRPLYNGNRDGYIFHRADGSPLRPDSVTRGFKRVLRGSCLPSMRFHDLRHATASILFDRGWSVPDVQHWLGHTDIETTMNIYVAYNATRKLKIGGDLTGIFE